MSGLGGDADKKIFKLKLCRGNWFKSELGDDEAR